MNPELIDIGSNLTHESFAPDREQVIERAIRGHVTHQVVTGADLASSRAAAHLAGANRERLSSTAGIHPHHAAAFEPAHREQLRALLAQAQVVAVGECGLDYFRDFSPRPAQRAAFQAQLEIAVAVRKPVFLHQRDAHADFTAILQDFHGTLSGGVAHCFTGGVAELEDYLALGLSIGITGWICDERRGLHLREVVRRIPGDRLMVETDAPYLLPRDLLPRDRVACTKARRNEPCYLPHIAAAVARARHESFADFAAASTRNAQRFFGIGGPQRLVSTCGLGRS